ncbi:MAG: hypothetical protein AUJ70_01000 [Candidatus Omnitrophica bacterium CG1_02_40_15]|nr:MAG: hypothetical protein AUJ70_01000 [Candidatus Omnitrophica bacterium CG1_02_40_15]
MALENWFEQGKLVKHKATKEELAAILGVVERNFQDASIKGLSSDQKYILSYQAAFEASLALIKCHGFRPIKAGHHYIVWQCMKDVLGERPCKSILLFEDAAKKRNKLSYDIAGLASQKEADEMCQESRNFVALIKEEIKKFNFA